MIRRDHMLEIQLEKAPEWIAKEKPLLLDFRDAQSFASGRVPNAKNVTLDGLEKKLKKISKEKPILAICYHGNRSYQATEFLRKNGYSRAFSLQHGTEGWKQAGYPTES